MSLLNNCSAKCLGRRLIYCWGVAAIMFVLVAALSCKPQVEPTPEVGPTPELEGGKLQESVATQKRINRYFHSEVMPKLKTCWERVQGVGTIEMIYQYENDTKGGWAFKTLEVGKSDLPEGQNTTAMACMQNAVTGTSFPREASETGETFLIDWVWPVPMPPDAEQQIARMFDSSGGGEGGGGCDGHGKAAKCMTCGGAPVECLTVCVGEDPPCTITFSPAPNTLKTCSCGGGTCASGGLFGVVGGMIMY